MSKKSINTVLLIEDNAGDARLLREMLNDQGSPDTELTHVKCMSEAEKHLAEHAVDIIVLDPGLPDAKGLEAIRRAHAAAPGIPLVVLTGLDDETLAAQALQQGAQDYLIKGQIEARPLLRALRYAIERKVMEEERERLQRLKNEFVSTVSHELRTPLTSISGSLGLLMNNTAGKLPDAADRLLAIAHTNSQRLVRLVNDILDIEKMESGQVVFNFKRVDVKVLVEQAIETSRGLAEGCGVQIRLENVHLACDVRADSDRLAQVVTNLLSNAIKFSPPNNEAVVAIENGTDIVRLSVRDHGPGIPANFKPHVFERFAQADGTNARKNGGTGLGLSIVKQIVDRLGGEVDFADAPGGGTIFYVELPCWEDMTKAMPLSAEPLMHGGNRRPRILHVDEDNVVAQALSEIADVVSVSSMDEARHALKTYDFDLAVLDIALAAGSSPDLLPDLRDSRGNAIPVVVFSDQGVNPANDAKAQAALIKSRASIDNLIATVRNRLASRVRHLSKETV